MLISPDEIYKALTNKDWTYIKNKLHKSYSFTDYTDGIDFVKNIALLAEKNNHHPDITITYCKVDVTITSHSFGGVTTKCINLAMGIDLLL